MVNIYVTIWKHGDLEYLKIPKMWIINYDKYIFISLIASGTCLVDHHVYNIFFTVICTQVEFTHTSYWIWRGQPHDKFYTHLHSTQPPATPHTYPPDTVFSTDHFLFSEKQ